MVKRPTKLLNKSFKVLPRHCSLQSEAKDFKGNILLKFHHICNSLLLQGVSYWNDFFHGSELDPDLNNKFLDFGFSGHRVVKIKSFIMPNTKANKISLNPDFGKLSSLTKHRISLFVFYHDGLTFFIIPTSAVSFSRRQLVTILW